MSNVEYNFALLIDSENASSQDIGDVISQLSVLGNIIIKRIYGDFTTQNSSSWKKAINDFSLTPVQQFSYTSGKNVTDSKMIIDAMDILYGGHVNAYCIMSSDSDFTGLAKRIKESGSFVCGAGKPSTPLSFVNSCDRFFTVREKIKTTKKTKKNEKKTELQKSKEDILEFMKFIISTFEEPGILLSRLMGSVYRKYPNFDSRLYGFKKPLDFIEDHKDIFRVRYNEDGSQTIFLKD